MTDRLDLVRADRLDRGQLIVQNEELRSMLADMHTECDEHEENSGRIIMELRAENERLLDALTRPVEPPSDENGPRTV